MHPAIRLDDITDLFHLQSIRRVLERLLHLSSPKPTQVSTVCMRGAVGVLARQLRKLVVRAIDLCLVPPQGLDGFLFGAGDIGLVKVGVSIYRSGLDR